MLVSISFLDQGGVPLNASNRQHIIGNYIVDFYIKSLSLVIEIDGKSHDYKGTYDEYRQAFLEDCGLIVYRIEDKAIKQDIGRVMQQLEDFMIQTFSTPRSSSTPLPEGNASTKQSNPNSPSSLKGWQPKADGVGDHA